MAGHSNDEKHGLSDEEIEQLVRDTVSGDQQAFKKLAETYMILIRAAVSDCDPRDLDAAVQEALLEIWKSLKGFEFRSKISTWMWRVAQRSARSRFIEPEKRQRQIEESLKPLYEASQPDPAESVARVALGAKVLGALPRDYREVFVLYEYYELSYEEIETELGLRPGTVASRLNRARKFVKTLRTRFHE